MHGRFGANHERYLPKHLPLRCNSSEDCSFGVPNWEQSRAVGPNAPRGDTPNRAIWQFTFLEQSQGSAMDEETKIGAITKFVSRYWASCREISNWLDIGYHNLRILLFGSFLLRSTPQDRASIPGSQEGVQKCLDSAKQTIDLIYQTYQHSDFFRTWYVMTSIFYYPILTQQ